MVILELFIPYAAEIPAMRKVMHMKNALQEYMDLFGNKRWRSIKIYNRNLIKIIDTIYDFIPWDEEKVIRWMNNMRAAGSDMTPAKLESM